MPKTLPGSAGILSGIIKNGSKTAPVAITKPADLRAYLHALSRFIERRPRYANLFIADPHRLFRALGVKLSGPAKEKFEQARQRDHWRDAPAEYDKIAASKVPFSSAMSVAIDDSSLAAISKTVSKPAGSPAIHAKIAEILRAVPTAAHTPIRPAPPPADVPLPSTGGSIEPEEGHSHIVPVDFRGVSDGWDVIVQLHASFFKRMYDLFFAAQSLADIFGGEDDVVNTHYQIEGWLLKLFLFDVTINGGAGQRTFTVHPAQYETVGVRMAMTLKISSRWTSDDPWEVDDEFPVIVTRYGKVTKKEEVRLGGTDMEEVFAADLAAGFTEAEAQPEFPLDDTRAALLEVALDNYFRDEMPFLVVSNEFVPDDPFVTWARAACFTSYTLPDMNTVTLAFGDKAREDGTSGDPFRNYILHYGRNITIGLSDQALIYKVQESMPDTPFEQDGVTVEAFTVALREGYLEVTAHGFKRVIVKVNFTYSVQINLKLDSQGNLTSELDDTDLSLPFWLWFLSFLLLSLPGIIILAITNALVKKGVDAGLGDQFSLNEDLSSLFTSSISGLPLTAQFDEIETNTTGVYISGDLEINP